MLPRGSYETSGQLDADHPAEQRTRLPTELDALNANLERVRLHRNSGEHERPREPALDRGNRDPLRQPRRDALPHEAQPALRARGPEQQAARADDHCEHQNAERERGFPQHVLYKRVLHKWALHKSDPMLKCSR